MHIIDAHQHFWQIDRGDYSWMDDSVAAIRRDYLPSELQQLSAPLNVSGTVAVQAAPTVAETQFLLTLADSNPSIQGVVGWVDLANKDALDRLDALSSNPRFKGVRPMLQDIEDTHWLLQPNVLKALQHVTAMGLSLDALVTPRHLPVLLELSQQLPELSIVIDHCAKPVIDQGHDSSDAWRDGMARLAESKNIYCKLSGLANEYGGGWSADNLRPVYSHVLQCFGSERLMWGSDWPVLELMGTYPDWLAAAQDLTASLPHAEQQSIFAGAATRFYRLG